MSCHRTIIAIVSLGSVSMLVGCGTAPSGVGGSEGGGESLSMAVDDFGGARAIALEADQEASQSSSVSLPDDLLEDAPDETAIVVRAADVAVTVTGEKSGKGPALKGSVHHASITFHVGPEGLDACDSDDTAGPFELTIEDGNVTLAEESLPLSSGGRSTVAKGKFEICTATWADFDGSLSIASVSFEFGQARGDEERVALCHVPRGNPGKAHTITVGASAVDAHLRHGDYLGECEEEPDPDQGKDEEEDDDGILDICEDDDRGDCPATCSDLTACGSIEFDPTFGTDGRAVYYVPGCDYDSSAYTMALQDDGKIVIGGRYYRTSIGRSMALLRVDAEGVPDPTFGGDGYVNDIYDFPSAVYGLAIQADGKIVVAGEARGKLTIVRLTADGALDTTFNGTGKVQNSSIYVSYDAGSMLALQPDGKLVVAGRTNNAFAVARYQASGVLDPSFGDGGTTTIALTDGLDEAFSLALQSDGKVVVVGRVLEPVPSDLMVGPGLNDGAMGVTELDDGRLMVYGYSKWNSYAGRMLIARFDSDGTLDTCFDEDGFHPVNDWPAPALSGGDRAHATIVQPDGKILVAGAVAPSVVGYMGVLRMTLP